MANENSEEKKSNPVAEFRKNMMNKDQLKTLVTDGLKSKNAKVRALAAKTAFRLGDHKFVKQNVLPLIATEKSKKVLRAIDSKITRKDLAKKVKAARVKKVAGGAKKSAAPAEGDATKTA